MRDGSLPVRPRSIRLSWPSERGQFGEGKRRPIPASEISGTFD
jgi:hypothetical protein